MKVYGLRIENIGLEFSTREDRDKAILTFTKGSTTRISDHGIRFTDNITPFGTYERETAEVLANCVECSGIFSTETCPKRIYPDKNSWEKSYSDNEGHICDGCLAKQEREKQIFEAKATLEKVSDIDL